MSSKTYLLNRILKNVAALLIIVGCAISKEKPNDLKEYNLSGDVESIEVTTYVAKQKFGELYRYKESGKLSRQSFCKV